MRMRPLLALVVFVSAVTPLLAQRTAAPPRREPDVVFVPTPPEVVDAMLKLATVTANDVVYDLGSGDGRIPIAAAKVYGARGVGIDIDPERVREATENAKANGVSEKVTFRNEDLFTTDFNEATVITVYLLPTLNLKLAPKLMKLKPGTRIVSHAFDMGDWKPQLMQTINGRPIYLWTVQSPSPRSNQPASPRPRK